MVTQLQQSPLTATWLMYIADLELLDLIVNHGYAKPEWDDARIQQCADELALRRVWAD